MKLQRYYGYSAEVLAEDFLQLLTNQPLHESKKEISSSSVQKILQTLAQDLKFNLRLITTFGSGIKVIYPIVATFIEKGLIKVDPSPENIVLLCITALSIIYLEETNNKAGHPSVPCGDCQGEECANCDGHGHVISEVSKADAQTMLTELKMRGVGNGVVKNLVLFFQKVGEIGHIIIKNTPIVVDSFLDMFGYTQLLVPIMNAIAVLCGNYTLTWDNLWTNLTMLLTGLGTLVLRRGYQWVLDKFKKMEEPPKSSIENINELQA